MPRPKIVRKVSEHPPVDYFKPRGIPMRGLEEVLLAIEELEALRLADLEGLSQQEAAEQMGVSRATFARVLHEARRKTADALVNGKALQIEGGTFELTERLFRCVACGHPWGEPFGTGKPSGCPSCADSNFIRVDSKNGDGNTNASGAESGARQGRRHGAGTGQGRGRGGR